MIVKRNMCTYIALSVYVICRIYTSDLLGIIRECLWLHLFLLSCAAHCDPLDRCRTTVRCQRYRTRRATSMSTRASSTPRSRTSSRSPTSTSAVTSQCTAPRRICNLRWNCYEDTRVCKIVLTCISSVSFHSYTSNQSEFFKWRGGKGGVDFAKVRGPSHTCTMM